MPDKHLFTSTEVCVPRFGFSFPYVPKTRTHSQQEIVRSATRRWFHTTDDQRRAIPVTSLAPFIELTVTIVHFGLGIYLLAYLELCRRIFSGCYIMFKTMCRRTMLLPAFCAWWLLLQVVSQCL